MIKDGLAAALHEGRHVGIVGTRHCRVIGRVGCHDIVGVIDAEVVQQIPVRILVPDLGEIVEIVALSRFFRSCTCARGKARPAAHAHAAAILAAVKEPGVDALAGRGYRAIVDRA